MKSKLFSSIGKSLLWSFLTVLFGLLQVWLIFGTSVVIVAVEFPIKDLLMEGAFLFFSTAIVASLTVDYHLSTKSIQSNFVTGFMFILFPTVIVISCVWLFTVCYGKEINEVEIKSIENAEYAILFVTGVYAFVTKVITFYLDEEDIKNEENQNVS